MMIKISPEDLQEMVYRMLRDIEDGKYKNIKDGQAMGCLSCSNTAALDEFMVKVIYNSIGGGL